MAAALVEESPARNPAAATPFSQLLYSPGGAKVNSREILSPLRGSFWFTPANPRLTPWATLYRPYGAWNCYTATMKMG